MVKLIAGPLTQMEITIENTPLWWAYADGIRDGVDNHDQWAGRESEIYPLSPAHVQAYREGYLDGQTNRAEYLDDDFIGI